MTAKRCSVCGSEKELAEFCPDRRKSDGRASRCRECHRKITREAGRRAYRENPEKYRARNHARRSDEATRAAERESWRKWRKRTLLDPAAAEAQRRKDRERRLGHERQKILARDAARAAVRNGILVRQPCEKCGERKTHAHHEDYSRPLDVRWLCVSCHGKEHRRVA